MNRSISITLSQIQRMREYFKGTDLEQSASELADKWTAICMSSKGVFKSTLQQIRQDIKALGVR